MNEKKYCYVARKINGTLTAGIGSGRGYSEKEYVSQLKYFVEHRGECLEMVAEVSAPPGTLKVVYPKGKIRFEDFSEDVRGIALETVKQILS